MGASKEDSELEAGEEFGEGEPHNFGKLHFVLSRIHADLLVLPGQELEIALLIYNSSFLDF